MFTSFFLVALTASSIALAHPSKPTSSRKQPFGKKCPPLNPGNIEVDNFKLYPENADWDRVNCKLYLGANYNATVLIYDPYTDSQEILEFPGISYNPEYHISGVDYDPFSASFFFSANTPRPFESRGTDLSGPNRLIRFDPKTREVVYNVDYAPYQDLLEEETGVRGSAFQDTAEDAHGNAYATVGNGNAIAKVNANGDIEPFYTTPADQINATVIGYGGLVAVNGGSKIVVADALSGTFVSFDTRASDPSPNTVVISDQPEGYRVGCDGLLAPQLYGQTVLLCSENSFGGPAGSITVFKSTDGWKTGRFIGQIDNAAVGGAQVDTALPVATVQIVDRLYILEEYFFDQGFPTVGPGNRTTFPLIDITEQVADLVA